MTVRDSTEQADSTERPRRLPLAGYRVVDFSSALAGPWAAGILAEQGADVVKIEQPGTGDVLRHTGPSHGGVSAFFHMANRGKRSIALDLRDPGDRETALLLVEGADVVVQNFRPGVADRLGVGYGALRARRADVILVSITGFGPTGPYAGRPAYDSVIQAAAGLASTQRSADDEPQLGTHTIADKITSMAAAQAAVTALLARERGHGGQQVDVPMFDVAVAFTWTDCAGWPTLVDAGVVDGSAATQGRRCVRFIDGWGAMTLGSSSARLGAGAVFGIATDLDPAAFMDGVRAVAATLPLRETADRLAAAGVPFAAVTSVDELVDDPQVVATDLLVVTHHPAAGALREPPPPSPVGGGL
ncbi:MAG: CoA transferase [Ilumatobacteraceae bacterium]